MRRREFLNVLGGAVTAWPAMVRAQQLKRPLRIGVVSAVNPRTSSFWRAFDERMRELGYIEGDNLSFDFVNLNNQLIRYDDESKALVSRGVDVIIAPGLEVSLKSAMTATKTVPIVMAAVDYDPFERGYVASLSRPGGNVTGVFFQQIELTVKRLQLFKDAFPDLKTATVFWDQGSASQWRAAQDAQVALGLSLAGVELGAGPRDYEQALINAPSDHRHAFIPMMSPAMFPDLRRLADLGLHHRIISIYGLRGFADAGGLMSYGVSIDGMFRRAADYVDRIVKGTSPAALPIEQPTKFELVVNLRTAKAIGVSLPQSILLRADEVIE
jgi:putative ABC transport system substrate-binding protein